MTCHPVSAKGHKYIIVGVDYFTNWVEAMPTFNKDGDTITLFIFNQVISHFDMPKDIFTNHGSHIQSEMMSKFPSKVGI